MALAGWSLAAILGILLAIIQWSWRKHAMESLAQGEFVAILFLQPETYENNKEVYLDWAASLPVDIEFPHAVAAAQAATNMSTSFMTRLGHGAGLLAVLTEYKKAHPV